MEDVFHAFSEKGAKVSPLKLGMQEKQKVYNYLMCGV